MKKLVLGTAQFGMDYGINNPRGRIPKEEALTILSEAYEAGIDTYDTAYAYGESQQILGEFMVTRKNVNVITKLPVCEPASVRNIIDKGLSTLRIERLYGCLIHDFKAFKQDGRIWDELEKVKTQGKAGKIGFSLYTPQELEYIFKRDIHFDIAQLPFNVLDQRFSGYFRELREKGVEIHIRSVFLQGLFFKDPDKLDARFISAKKQIAQLRRFAEEYDAPVFSLCLNFALTNDLVDKVVVGIDNISHLRQILDADRFLGAYLRVKQGLSGLKIDDEQIIVPSNWAKA
jgi:aryl-alcohol dehydrogenase-like predicted oxidoreductase